MTPPSAALAFVRCENELHRHRTGEARGFRAAVAVFKQNGWDGKGSWAEWLDGLRERAVAEANGTTRFTEEKHP